MSSRSTGIGVYVYIYIYIYIAYIVHSIHIHIHMHAYIYIACDKMSVCRVNLSFQTGSPILIRFSDIPEENSSPDCRMVDSSDEQTS